MGPAYNREAAERQVKLTAKRDGFRTAGSHICTLLDLRRLPPRSGFCRKSTGKGPF